MTITKHDVTRFHRMWSDATPTDAACAELRAAGAPANAGFVLHGDHTEAHWHEVMDGDYVLPPEPWPEGFVITPSKQIWFDHEAQNLIGIINGSRGNISLHLGHDKERWGAVLYVNDPASRARKHWWRR